MARELTEKDALGAHVRDELGLSDIHSANPLQAAIASGLTFCAAAALPVLAAVLAPAGQIIPTVVVTTLIALAVDDEVVVGVVSAPALQRRWWASAGGGAWTGRSLLKATRCQVSDVRRLEDAYRRIIAA